MRLQISLTVALSVLSVVLAGPALAQSIDLSPIQSLLQGIVDALTGVTTRKCWICPTFENVW